MADPIAFKLNDDQTTKLQAKAEQYDASSLGKFVKRIVIDYLEDGERERMRNEVAELRHEIIRLREDLAAVVAVLLVKAGKVNNPQEANEWAEKNLLSPRSRC